MPYITRKNTEEDRQLSWADVFAGKELQPEWLRKKKACCTITRLTEADPTPLDELCHIMEAFKSFNLKYDRLISADKHSLYNTFYIPKQHGGRREINAPVPEMMNALKNLRYILEVDCGSLYHTSAFAYVPGRCTKDMDLRHAANESNWFLKTDFSGFFPSSSLEFVMRMLEMIVPFDLLLLLEKDRVEVKKALSLAFLDDGLPQGSPVSPCISNLMMIPFDHTMTALCAKKKYVYTRYADDITVSSVQSFNPKEVLDMIRSTLQKLNAPFVIKDEKTRYVNNKGSNWLLGLMVNKDHHVTVGHQRKKYLKAELCNFVLDAKNGKRWSVEDVMSLNGRLSYYKMIERDYFDYVIRHMNEKFHVNAMALLRAAIANDTE